jgi:hypothetical protein
MEGSTTTLTSSTNVKNASKSSKPMPVRLRAAETAPAAGAAEALRRERRRYYELLAPPDVRHRRKEARRWLDELTVRVTNGRVCERRPGHRHISFAESQAVWLAQREELRKTDLELFRGVRRLEFEEDQCDMGITLEEWKIRSHRRTRRISKVRAEMQRAGLI